MCGIAGFYFFKPNEKIDQQKLLDVLIWGIDSRGGDACGFSAFDEKGLILHEVAACDAKTFIKGRRIFGHNAQYVIAHTRFATQGHQGFLRNNHPVRNEGVHVTHNGHISNDRAIFEAIGWDKRHAEVDTEAISASVAAHGWENWQVALESLEGGFAVAMANENYPGELILAKGEMSPLIYFTNGRILLWASTHECLLSAWKQCIGKAPDRSKLKALKLGEAIVVKDGEMSIVEFQPKTIPWQTKYAYYDGWSNSEFEEGWEKIADGVWKPKSAQESAKVLMPGKPEAGASISIANLGALEPEVEALRAEHDKLRRRTEEIMGMGDRWWDDDELLNEFNGKWAVIREIKEEIEELTWAAVTYGELVEPEIEIQCPACLLMHPLAEMDTRPGIDGELYCADCLDDWDALTA
jgi:predicted glutamine amidotransferase